ELLADADPAVDQRDVERVLRPRAAVGAAIEERRIDRILGEDETVLIDLGEQPVLAPAARDRRDGVGAERVLEREGGRERAASGADARFDLGFGAEKVDQTVAGEPPYQGRNVPDRLKLGRNCG